MTDRTAKHNGVLEISAVLKVLALDLVGALPFSLFEGFGYTLVNELLSGVLRWRVSSACSSLLSLLCLSWMVM